MPDPISDAQEREMGTPDFDPRDIVTPHAFEVDTALLNTPLAEPWRRLASKSLIFQFSGTKIGVRLDEAQSEDEKHDLTSWQ